MLAIIPHQNDELKLINIQKKLTGQLNNLNNNQAENQAADIKNNSYIFFQSMPLWINVTSIFEKSLFQEQNEKKLKEISKSIKEIKISSLVLKNTEDFSEDILITNSDYTIAAEVIIKTEKENVAYLPLVQNYKSTSCTGASDMTEDSDSTGNTREKSHTIEPELKQKIEKINTELEENQEIPLNIKIFRLATATKNGKKSYSVKDFAWGKLNQKN